MNYVVLDLEWNQGNSTMERRDEVMPFEVIEIGAVKLDENLSHISDFSRLVRPTRYHSLHFIAGKLLHITMEELASQQPFPEVCRDFLRWCGEDYVFVTWGPADLTELQRNMRWHGMGALSDGPIPFLDAQKLYSLSHLERHERLSLETAVDQCGIRKDIQFHRAYDDAYYTALILEKLPRSIFSYYSFDYFTLPKDKSAEVHVKFDTYAKYISRGFKDRHQALEDQTVMSTVCYLCGRVLKRHSVAWFTPNGKQYYCVSWCPEHGYMKAKVRLRKTDDGLVYVVKTERFIGEDDVNELRGRSRKQMKKERKTASMASIRKSDSVRRPDSLRKPDSLRNPGASRGSKPLRNAKNPKNLPNPKPSVNQQG